MYKLTLTELRERLYELYPSIKNGYTFDARRTHYHGILGIVEGVFERELIREDPPDCSSTIPDTAFGRRLRARIAKFEVQYKSDVLNKHPAALLINFADLPSHEEILAYKLMTDDGNHPAATVTALSGTDADFLLYPLTLPPDYWSLFELGGPEAADESFGRRNRTERKPCTDDDYFNSHYRHDPSPLYVVPGLEGYTHAKAEVTGTSSAHVDTALSESRRVRMDLIAAENLLRSSVDRLVQAQERLLKQVDGSEKQSEATDEE